MRNLIASGFRKVTNSIAQRVNLTPSTHKDDMAILLGKLHVQRVRQLPPYTSFREAEFKVFSQFGDDGIIQYILHQIGDIEPSFIEFGVEDYLESNTRFLLAENNWRGLVIDGDAENIERLRSQRFFWQHDLTAVAAFITKDNINSIFQAHGYRGDIGILSVDLDGNDYWILKAIDSVRPTLLICEYNSVFGDQHAISIPYDPAFQRTRAHYSNLYWGCSLAALDQIAKEKGYCLVGCNSAGNNAYFVRNDRLQNLTTKTCRDAYVQSLYRESRDQQGRKTFASGALRLELIKDLPVVNVATQQQVLIRDIFHSQEK